METQEYVTYIKEKTIFDVNDKRSINRSSALNVNRANYDEIEKRLQAPAIDEFKELCKFYIQKKKDRDLYRIRLGLSLGCAHITAFHDVDGALYTLVSSLTGGTPQLQMEALYCLINLGLGNEAQCRRVCDKVGIYLISLGSDNEILQELCLWVFGNLCGGHPKVCQIAQRQGVEGSILHSLSSSQVPAVTQAAAYALNHYLNSVQNRIRQFSSANVIGSMIDVGNRDPLSAEYICCGLFCMSTQRVLCSTLIESGVAKFALKILNTSSTIKECESISTDTSLIRILTNCIASNNLFAIQLLNETDSLPPVCCRLLQSSQSFLISETIQFIANLFNTSSKQSIEELDVLEEEKNLKTKLEPHLKVALASHFNPCKEAAINFV